MSEASDGRASRLYVIDAKSMTAADRPSSASEEVLSGGAVAALSLPGAVPYGLHSCWLGLMKNCLGRSGQAVI